MHIRKQLNKSLHNKGNKKTHTTIIIMIITIIIVIVNNNNDDNKNVCVDLCGGAGTYEGVGGMSFFICSFCCMISTFYFLFEHMKHLALHFPAWKWLFQ